MNKTTSAVFLMSFLLMASNTTSTSPTTEKYKTIPVETAIDKIRGGLLGQMLGNLNGIPHEFEYFEEPGNVKNYVPSLPTGAITDDDTDFEWVYIYEMQKRRKVLLYSEEITSLWKERINRRIWFSNLYARYLMDIGIKPPYTGSTALNPWASFNISGSFLSETFGLIAPAMPQTAAKIGLNYTTVAISAEPAQTTQLFTTMISTAFIEDDIEQILDAGVASLDPDSKTLILVNDIRKWHSQYPDNWRELRRLLKEKYTQEGGNIRDNNGTEINTGSTIAALLYGEGDFSETLRIAFNMGWDADNTAAAAGTIIGVTYGYRKMLSEGWMIVDRYKNTTREKMPMDETITSFADRLIELFEMVNRENGGQKTLIDKEMTYEIPQENPQPVVEVISPKNQKKKIRLEFAEEIKNNLLNGNIEQKARAAYMAVCLEMDEELRKKHPEQWDKAIYNLNGYWKLKHVIFSYNFNELKQLRGKFVSAGLKEPVKKYSKDELWNSSQIWRNPDSGME